MSLKSFVKFFKLFFSARKCFAGLWDRRNYPVRNVGRSVFLNGVVTEGMYDNICKKLRKVICIGENIGFLFFRAAVAPYHMRVMYDRFSRAVDTRLNKVRGSGLGLSIVKELIDLMDGHIEASSVLGKGTTFKVTFELDYTDQKHEHKHECRIDGKYDECIGMRILVAEDNDLNYEIAEELLKLHGVICDRAEKGQVCVNIFRESAPFYYSAILMDLQMPVMDGLRAARLIRSTDSDYARKIPIIALSANAFSEDVKASLDAGMDEHLSKPFDADKLLELLMLHKNK